MPLADFDRSGARAGRFEGDPVELFDSGIADLGTLPRDGLRVEAEPRRQRALPLVLDSSRFVTLTGAPGVGKTRLALQVAEKLRRRYSAGVWLVELGLLFEGERLAQVVADAIELASEPGHNLLTTLVDALQRRHALLLLDNCEHLVEACAGLAATLLSSCPAISILATSRQPLGVPGETIWRVPVMPVPGALDGLDAGGARSFESVRLFEDRASSVQAGFAVTDQNAAAVAQICQRLDGIPLAVELAAARVPLLSPQQLLRRLDHGFELLSGGSRTALPHHHTLQALVDWSYKLLSGPERRLLARLSVFVGGFTPEAAESVCSGGGIPAAQVLPLLGSLVEKSLVAVEQEREEATRYRLLETVRKYARDRLAPAELSALQGTHAQHCLALALQADAGLKGADQLEWIARLGVEHADLRAALAWCSSNDSPRQREWLQLGLELAEALWWFWYTCNHWEEGYGWLARFASATAFKTTPARVRALAKAGMLAFMRGDPAAAANLQGEALLFARQIDDALALAWALGMAVVPALYQGQLEQAEQLARESVAVLGGAEGSDWEQAACRGFLGIVVLQQGNIDRAIPEIEAALGIFRRLGERYWMASALSMLGLAAMRQGDYRRAQAHLAESATLYEELGNRVNATETLERLGQLALLQGRRHEAAVQFRQCLLLADQVGRRQALANGLTGAAGTLAADGQTQWAVRLYAAAARLRQTARLRLAPQEEQDQERRLAGLRSGAPKSYDADWAAGESLTLAEAIREADRLLLAVAEAAPAAAQAPVAAGKLGVLTPRERDVAALLARGLKNREIAERLVIAEGTAALHVKRILAKLDLSSRAQVAAWLVDLDAERLASVT